MSYHEINVFNNEAAAKAKAAEHKIAGRTNVMVTDPPGHDSVIIYDNRNGNAKVIFDEEGPPSLFIVESDGI